MNKTFTMLFALLAIAATVSASQSNNKTNYFNRLEKMKIAADISGKWTMTADDGSQKIEAEFDLKQTANNFSGTVSSAMGNGTIEKGLLKENDFTAVIKADVQGQAVEFQMQGKLEGEKMSGQLSGQGLPTVTFTAVKNNNSATSKAADISGKWSANADANGQQIDITLVIKQDGKSFTGTMDSMHGGGTLEKGVVTDSKMSATLKANIMGQEMELQMDGNIKDGKITGTFTGQNLQVPFTAVRPK